MSTTCCPENYTYVDSLGYYYDPILGPTLIINNAYTTPSFNDLINHCGLFMNRGYATSVVSAEDCPCCPQGYSYSQIIQACCPGSVDGSVCDVKYSVPSIPCLPCDCTEPEPRVCETCTTDTLPISFSLNTDRKACTDCEAQQGFREIPKGGKVNSFMPYFLLDPGTNFIRK